MPRILGWAALLFGVTAAVFWWIHRPDGPRPPAVPSEGAGAEVTIQGFHYIQRQGGKIAWEIEAERAERYLREGRIRLQGVRGRFRRSSGDWIRISSDGADYAESVQRLDLRGNVRILTDTGYLLQGEHLVWDRRRSLILSEDPVRLVAPLYIVTGKDLRYRIDRRSLGLSGGVRTVIPPASGRRGT